ncbi:autotransporter outer membrane beta-barrel domain-containing protein [Megasphaera stantonii]|uniref:autotransporter outer membrane beta-barrel domain-containing protein n=1 Tax=Megasphaera stantonii TaxID=2144175 RepID=UPI00294230F4|nr:autotransporter outer membrane beta-barrel domain-containing protein [Megasphaera stantonii]
MKGKQLRKAVLLGMAMSMVVWTTGMAQEPITDDFTYNKAESITVTNTEEGQAAIQVTDKEVSISPTDEGSTIKLESAGSGIRTEGGSNGSMITLTSSGGNEIYFNSVSDAGDGITVDDVSTVKIETAGQNYIHAGNFKDLGNLTKINGGDGVRISGNGHVSMTGQTNKIEVVDDGLHIQSESGEDANIELIATGSGEDKIGNYIVGNNGVRIDAEKAGDISVIANNGNNVIHGVNDAVYNSGSGTITIQAGFSSDTGISLLDDFVGYNNVLTAGANGVHSDGTGTTNVIADNDNIIAGTTNGILSNDSGTINVTAGNDNFIGQYADESGRTVTSQNGINVTAGTVNVTGNANKIYALGTGILLSGTESPGAVNLYGMTNEISVGSTDSTEDVAGIYFSNTSDKVVNIQGGIGEDNTPLYSDNISVNVSSAGDAMGVKFDGANNNTVNMYADEISINASSDGGRGNAIWVQSTASGNTINLNAAGDVYLSADMSKQSGSGAAVWLTGKDNTLSITGGNNTITTENSTVRMEGLDISGSNSNVSLTATDEGGNNTVTSQSVALNALFADTISLDAQHGSNRITSLNNNGISIANVNGVKLTASDQNNIQASSDGISFTTVTSSGKVTLNAKDNIITAGGDGIYLTQGTTGSVDMIAHGGNNEITADKNHGIAVNSSYVSLIADQGKNIIKSNNPYNKWDSAIYAVNEGSKVTLTALQNEIYGKKYGINSGANKDGGIVTLTATEGNNEIASEETGIYSKGSGEVTLNAGLNNWIKAGNILKAQEENDFGFGDSLAINALDVGSVTLDAGNANFISGAVYAGNAGTVVDIKGAQGVAVQNYAYSSAVVDNAGNLSSDDTGKFDADTKVISSLYAEDSANITVSGDWNEFRTYADDPADDTTLERTIWAYEGANIEINGSTLISTDRYAETSALQPHNSADIAIAAGTAVNLDETKVEAGVDEADRAKVTLHYGAGSSITGDVLSAYAGKVDIAPQESTTRSNSAGISITGNLLAGNNGVLNVDLGNGGSLVGRTDDYGDANDKIVNDEHIQFFNPAFSSTIYRGGEVNLTMGSGSYWDVTGQSWLTSLKGDGGIIDMRNSENEKTTSHAVHVDTITGNHTFVMDLNHDNHNVSDMLYIKDPNASAGEQTIFINRLTGVEDMADGEKLRFATVNASTDKLSFVGQYEGENGYGNKARVMMRDIGVMDMALTIENEKYTTADTENTGYNGTDFTETKPGDEYVDETYTDGTNWYLTRTSSGDTTSDAGKTVVAMSRINYSNAVYMDRLNKRMGEARYIDGDEGLWVRMRHDRIGKSDAFRSMNTMMELGYDTRVNDREDGEHRQGVAIDYMRGTADYKNVAGEGDVRRGGIWFYDTWLGNKGHYTDYVLKFGRLSNDFELYTRTLGEKVTGDYSNFVYSASAEYGRKKDLGNNWYIEPQAQIQYAHVTDADYTTSQDTHVQLDAIDSLIGRVGFRLGKDVGEKSTFYIKADVLHEFLGDQDIEARDATGLLSTTYENEGTWYDIGLGFSHQFSKGTYMYLDMEKSIGNDNEDTYQFNFGMNWKV